MRTKSTYRVGVVGASGVVGREVLSILEERKFPLSGLRAFCSSKSAGKQIPFHSTTLEVLTDDENFEDLDIVFFTAGSAVSSKFAPRAAKSGSFVIDNASVFRMRPDVPLVVPEVNGSALEQARHSRLVANPNCTTAQMVMVLKPLHDHFRIQRIVLSSYQAVSGKGQKGIEEFDLQIREYVASTSKSLPIAFPHRIAFNCLPHIDLFQSDGFTGEEHKVMDETRKILGDPSIRVLATCVRVPVLNCHSESVAIQTEKPVNVEQARRILEQMPGVRVLDEPSLNSYPLAMDVSGKDDVFVGRIRQDVSLLSNENGLTFWIVADNLRKGAALNAVQIAEAAIERNLVN